MIHKILDPEFPSKMDNLATAHESQNDPGLQHLRPCVVSQATDEVHCPAIRRKVFSGSSYQFLDGNYVQPKNQFIIL